MGRKVNSGRAPCTLGRNYFLQGFLINVTFIAQAEAEA